MKYLPLVLMLSSHPVWANDILWMKNGDRLTGNIEEFGDESVRIALPYTGAVTVKRDAIKRWRLDKQEKPKATAKGGIALFKDEQNERKGWLWTGSGDLNLKIKDSDKKTNNINVKGTTELANPDWRYSLSGEYNYDTANHVTDSHDYQLTPTLDYFFDQHWFARSSLNAEYDMLETNYLKLDYGTGPGYRFWNEKRRRLEFVVQGGLRKHYYREGLGIEEYFEGKRIIDYPFASMSWDYRQPIALWQEKLDLFSQGRYLHYLAQPSPHFILKRNIGGSLGLRYYFNEHVRLSWSTDIEYSASEVHWGDLHGSVEQTELKHFINLGASF